MSPDPRPAERLCPRCGGPVEPFPTCHTWPQAHTEGNERWMSCLPCDSATDWLCVADPAPGAAECGWSYTEGLNPRNPRAAENEMTRPAWLPVPVEVTP